MQIFQLCLDEEVTPSKSIAQRSTTTGHLVITMPMARETLCVTKTDKSASQASCAINERQRNKRETLEVDPSSRTIPDIENIIKDKPIVPPLGSKPGRHGSKVERENSPDFIDDPDVPPLM